MRRLLPLALSILALTLALAVLPAPAARAAELAGVTMPDKLDVDGHTLVLNGLGLRKKFFIKVYVGGLYLPAKQADGAKVLAADGPRRSVLHFLYGVDKKKICEAWDESLEKNTPGASAELKRQFATLCTYMDDLAKGERMSFTYLPGEGTAVEVKGQAKGTIPGKAFADALFASWIGAEPATEELKEGMLGG